MGKGNNRPGQIIRSAGCGEASSIEIGGKVNPTEKVKIEGPCKDGEGMGHVAIQ